MFRTCKTFLAQIFKWPNKRKDCSDFVTFQPLSRIYNFFLLYILFRSCNFPTFVLSIYAYNCHDLDKKLVCITNLAFLHRINNNNNNNNLPLQILQLQILQSPILHYMFYPRGLRLNLVLVLFYLDLISNSKCFIRYVLTANKVCIHHSAIVGKLR